MVRESRGQLILVAAILVALSVLASVVLLNAMHIPADLKTGPLEEDTNRIQQLDDSVRDDIDRIFVTVTDDSNLGGTRLPFVDNVTAFESAVADSMAIRGEMSAKRSGGVLSVEFNQSESLTGPAVYQTSNEEFTNGSSGSWVALENASRVNVELEIADHDGGNATLYVENGTPWRLNVSNSKVTTSTGGHICDAPDFDEANIRVAVRGDRGTVWTETDNRTTRCGEFEFGGTVSPEWTVGFENGDLIEGRYGIAGQGDLSKPYAVGLQSATNVIVNPAFDVRYVTDGITYKSTYALYNQTGR